MIDTFQKHTKELESVLSNKTTAVFIIFLVGLALPAQGFCNDAEMNTMATGLVDTIFAPWVRKTVLALGGGLGGFRSVGSGSFQPLLLWGGIGLVYNFIPKLINFLSTLGI